MTAAPGSKRKKPSRKKGIIGALDLGGTNIKTALVDRSGAIVARDHRPTEAHGGSRHVIGRMAEALGDLCSSTGISVTTLGGVGVGFAGPLNPEEGVVYHAPNLPGGSREPRRAR